ncbi:MAG TPA: N-acetylmuramoyl-L-alanine amidase [Gemmatimonadaceae bacterium]
MRKALLPALGAILLFGSSCRSIARPAIEGAPGRVKAATPVIVWQPSHQTDTGADFNEALVCNGIVEAAMATQPQLNEYKVWSYGVPGLHHANTGSNTAIEQTSSIVDGQLSGYAYELQQANRRTPDVFIAVHNNGGTKRHAVWGYIHDGDKFEAENRELATRLVEAISAATDLENRGVLLDSSTGRNNYRCESTGRLGFYSLDEHVNNAPYRVLLEIGDNGVSRAFLQDPANQRILGEAIKKALTAWLAERK